MSFETELRDQLHAGVDDTDVDLAPLLTGSIAYGNKLVRRRRLTRIFAGAATIAVLGGAFAYAGSLGGTASPDGTGIAPAGPVVAQGKKADITPQAALQILLDTLPSSKPATNYRGGLDGNVRKLGIYALVDYTGGGSTAMVRTEIIKTGYPLLCDAGDRGCTVTILPDGSKLRLIDWPANLKPGDAPGFRHLEANLARKDGLNLNLAAINYPAQNPNSSPKRPPVSLAELKAIAISPRWQLRLDQSFLDQTNRLFVPRQLTQPSQPEIAGTTPR